jgi:hypothetical protein
MNKDYLNILIFTDATFGIRRLRIQRETLRILFFVFLFFQVSVTVFLCDYIQVKRKEFHLNQLRQEAQFQKSQIQLFAAKTEELEKKLSKLKDFDRRIRIIANLERGHEAIPFIGMGGPSSSLIRRELKEEPKASE